MSSRSCCPNCVNILRATPTTMQHNAAEAHSIATSSCSSSSNHVAQKPLTNISSKHNAKRRKLSARIFMKTTDADAETDANANADATACGMQPLCKQSDGRLPVPLSVLPPQILQLCNFLFSQEMQLKWATVYLSRHDLYTCIYTIYISSPHFHIFD